MSLQRHKPPRPVGADPVATQRCLGPQARPAHVIVGVSTEGDVGMAGKLVAEWLANVFGQPFTQNRTGESDLAIEAFYDALHHSIGDSVFVGAIGLAREDVSSPAWADAQLARLLQAEPFQLIHETAPIMLHFRGIARALFNRASGPTLVRFDHLPGALEFVGEPAPGPRPDQGGNPSEATAWYGFGTVMSRQVHSGVSHSIVDAEFKRRPAGHA